MAAAPVLTWMTVWSSVADLLINRILLRSWEQSWSREVLVQLDRWGAFSRNLAVMSGLVALTFCLVAFSARRSQLPLSARVGLAGFGGAFVPTVALMAALPRASTRLELVLIVAALAHALILLLILVGLRWRTSPAIVTTMVTALAASMCGVAALIVSLIGGRMFWAHTERLANAFRWAGEIAYLVLPIMIGFAVGIRWRERRSKVVLAVSTAVAAAAAATLFAWRLSVGMEFPTVFYGATRLDLLPDANILLYAIPLGIGAAVSCVAVLSKDPAHRQMGAALILLLAAGYAPRTPTVLVMTVLAIGLLARSAVAGREPAVSSG